MNEQNSKNRTLIVYSIKGVDELGKNTKGLIVKAKKIIKQFFLGRKLIFKEITAVDVILGRIEAGILLSPFMLSSSYTIFDLDRIVKEKNMKLKTICLEKELYFEAILNRKENSEILIKNSVCALEKIITAAFDDYSIDFTKFQEKEKENEELRQLLCD